MNNMRISQNMPPLVNISKTSRYPKPGLGGLKHSRRGGVHRGMRLVAVTCQRLTDKHCMNPMDYAKFETTHRSPNFFKTN